MADQIDTGDEHAGTPIARGAVNVSGARQLQDGWEVPTCMSTAALTIAEAITVTKVLVRAPLDGAVAGSFPPLGRVEHRAGILLVGSGPGEWLLMATGRPAQSLIDQSLPPECEEFVTWVDLTHGRALIRLTGNSAAQLMAKVCAVNLADKATPNGTAFRTPVASVTTDIIRDDHGSTRSYLLHCERSSGQYLFAALLDAGAEFGTEPSSLLGLGE